MLCALLNCSRFKTGVPFLLETRFSISSRSVRSVVPATMMLITTSAFVMVVLSHPLHATTLDLLMLPVRWLLVRSSVCLISVLPIEVAVVYTAYFMPVALHLDVTALHEDEARRASLCVGEVPELPAVIAQGVAHGQKTSPEEDFTVGHVILRWNG